MAVKGVDISAWQKGLSLAKVKDAGKKFVILRAGFTGINSGTQKNVDATFRTFYKQAKAEGLGVGAYWYSCANTYAKGKAEAEFMIKKCLKGKQFEYPIYIDVEEKKWQTVGKKAVGNAIKGFCETMEKHGYYAGFYTSTYFLNAYIDKAIVKDYDLWLANWSSSKPSIGRGYGMWQYTDATKVAGRSLDGDIAYKDYPKIMKSKGLNGFKKPAKDTGKKDTKPVKKPATKKKSVVTLAKEVINGKWGNGDNRVKKLKAAGYDPTKVQAEVNKLMGKK